MREWAKLLAALAVLGFAGCSAMVMRREAGKPSMTRPGDPVHGAAARAVLKRRSRAAEPWERVGTFDELWVIERSKAPAPAAGSAEKRPRPGQGMLSAVVGDKQVPLPLKRTDVRARISAFIASVDVTQQYANPYRKKIDVVYSFPLPGNAAVTDFVVRIGERRIRGIIRERAEARKIYEEARRQGHVASLLTQDRPNIFTQRLGNIEPGRNIDVRISYFGPLRYADGEYEFVFPMTAGGLKPGAERGGREVVLKVEIDAGVAIEKVYSRTHKIKVTRRGRSKANAVLEAAEHMANRDFVLRYRVAGERVKTAMMFQRGKTGNYFALLLQPPAKAEKLPRTKREMVFVLDCSASMSGAPLARVKETVRRCLSGLDAGDTFRIVRFSERASALGPKPLPATPENVKRGLAYLDALNAWGGTAMLEGVKAALEPPADQGRLRLVSFMTDGCIANEIQVLAVVKEKVGSARVFSLGVGRTVNRYLLERMARLGRGAVAFVDADGPASARVDGFYRTTGRPALSDVEIDWGGMKVAEVYPQRVPDLFAGRPVVIVGRFAGRGKQALRVSGRVGGKAKSFALNVDPDAAGAGGVGIDKLWARWKIAELHGREMARPAHQVRRQVTAASLRYGVLCRYTAFLVVDSLRKTKGGHGETVKVPLPAPEGGGRGRTAPR